MIFFKNFQVQNRSLVSKQYRYFPPHYFYNAGSSSLTDEISERTVQVNGNHAVGAEATTYIFLLCVPVHQNRSHVTADREYMIRLSFTRQM